MFYEKHKGLMHFENVEFNVMIYLDLKLKTGGTVSAIPSQCRLADINHFDTLAQGLVGSVLTAIFTPSLTTTNFPE